MKPDSPARPRAFFSFPPLILLLGVLFLSGWVGWQGYRNVGFWLAQSDGPQKAEVMVCLGGPERIRKAAELFHQGYAQRVILTAEKTTADLTRLQVPASAVTLVLWPKTTYQEALAVAPLIQGKGYPTLIFKSGHWPDRNALAVPVQGKALCPTPGKRAGLRYGRSLGQPSGPSEIKLKKKLPYTENEIRRKINS